MIKKEEYGVVNKQIVYKYTITNKNGNTVVVSDFGGTILNIFINKNDKVYDVALGYNKLESYFDNGEFIGCVVAPTANRINKGQFSLNGKSYQMDQNDRGNNLHTHFILGAQKMLMASELKENEIIFSCQFKDGVASLPGNKDFSVSYKFDDDNQLIITYQMTSDQDTLFNPTQHCYFNLNGHNSGSILSHTLQISASKITEVNDTLIPTGKLIDVANTPFDFRKAKKVGQDVNDKSLENTGGYDHNFALDDYDGSLRQIVYLVGDKSEIKMSVSTDLPGIQIYGGNFLNRVDGKQDCHYQKNDGIALETQFFPDNINHDNFASSVIKANTTVRHQTVYKWE